jgi:creatinine amidohydrolase/Fe(II)-dependent formamide hydrolase-like protein
MRMFVALAVVLMFAPAAAAQSVFVEDMTWPEIRDAMAAGKKAAIIYAGGIEQNGPHMALAKHNLIARHVAAQVAQKLGTALVYPIIPFSPAGDGVAKTGHMRFPGTVSLTPDVFLGVVRQVTQSALAAGFTQVYLMADHGQGIAEMRVAAETLDGEWRAKGARVRFIDTQTAPSQKMNAYMKEKGIVPGGHAGVAETSQVIALAERAQIRRDKYALTAAGPEPAAGALVDPTPATAEMGRMFLDMKVAAAVEQIQAAAAQK